MKTFGIGLIILLIGIALLVGHSGLEYYWIHNPPDTLEETENMLNQMKIATSLGLGGNIVALIGVVIFIAEFMKHEHARLRYVDTRRYDTQIRDLKEMIDEISKVLPKETQARIEKIKTQCPQCGKKVPKGFKSCPYCGFDMGTHA